MLDPTISSFPIPRARFADGGRVARLGLGTWRMGEVRRERAREVAALREGIAMGMTLIDTAKVYREGGLSMCAKIAGQPNWNSLRHR